MSTATASTMARSRHETSSRILQEGYGDGAWHGPDLKAALEDVSEATAFWRPGPDRHNIAEIALHHAYCVRGVRAKLTGADVEPFVLEGDDWFALPDPSVLAWATIRNVVAREQERLAACSIEISAGRSRSPLPESGQFDLVLGITCHAVYHAGQIQLIKRLAAA
jgi:DinB family protein